VKINALKFLPCLLVLFIFSCKKSTPDVPTATYHTLDFQPANGQDVSVFYFQNSAGIDSLNVSTKNFYGDTLLYANTFTSAIEKTGSGIFLKFDSASFIPASAKIIMAHIYLYGIDTSNIPQNAYGNTIPGGGNSYFIGLNDSLPYYDSLSYALYNTNTDTAYDNTLLLQQVGAAWSAQSITDSTQPSLISLGNFYIQSSSSQWNYNIAIDVTNLAKQWQSNPSSNNGINLTVANTNYLPSIVYINHQMVFYSSSAIDPQKHPEMVIVYQ
jgi:hypothetical protein